MIGDPVTVDALVAAANRALQPGIRREEAVVIGYAELVGEPLDPFDFDHAAIILRAARLCMDGLGVGEAVRTARHEQATWNEIGRAHV